MADKYIYGNSTDLTGDMAKAYGAQGYTYTNDASKLGAGSVVLGGAGSVGGLQDSALNGATRLSGADRYGTATAASNYLGTLQNQQQQAATPQVYDPTNDIKAMAAAQKAAALAGLSSAHDKSLSDLSAANGKIEPAYYTQRNAASTDNQVAARNFAEYMAQRGMTNSGTSAQSDIASNMSLQGNLGSLAKGEAGAYADNAKQVGDVNTAYNNDIASTTAGIDATSMQSLITAQQQYNASKLAQANTDRGYSYQVGRDTVGDTGYSNGVQTLAGQTTMSNIKSQSLQNDYQSLVNANYPAEQALKMAQAKASLTGTNLQNDMQTLQNAGYPAEEAAKLASSAAQIRQSDASIRQGDTQNAIAQQNANTNSFSAQSDASYKQASLAAARASATSKATSKAANGGLTVAQQAAANKVSSAELLNNVTASIMNKVYGNNTTKKALNSLTGSKSGILHDLTVAGMSAKDALSYYDSMYKDLTSK